MSEFATHTWESRQVFEVPCLKKELQYLIIKAGLLTESIKMGFARKCCHLQITVDNTGGIYKGKVIHINTICLQWLSNEIMNPLSRKTFCQSRVLLEYDKLTDWSGKLTFFVHLDLNNDTVFCANNQDCSYIYWCYLHTFSCSVHSISTDTVHKCRHELGKICRKKIQSNIF